MFVVCPGILIKRHFWGLVILTVVSGSSGCMNSPNTENTEPPPVTTTGATNTDYGCGVATPYVMGAGVTIVQCWGSASTTGAPGQSSYSTGVDGGGLTPGDSLLIFGYQCYPSSSNCGTPSSTTYLFPCYSGTASNCATNLISDGSCTQLYWAFLQSPSTGNYPNYAWYCKSLPSNSGGTGVAGGINLQCSSTSSSFTAASDCQYISVFLTEFTGGCTTSNTECFDQSGNSNVSSAMSLTVSTGNKNSSNTSSTLYTNELVCALGGTVHDEILSATNGGLIMTPGASGSYSPGNTVFCKIAGTPGVQTLGMLWSPSDEAGMLMVTLQTAESAGPQSATRNRLIPYLVGKSNQPAGARPLGPSGAETMTELEQ